ncbi:hypothetical protein QSI_3055 [Clostridioides difficile P28]|nr:hypothetical protein QSI_3055 [Clostridioides difficile P28]
MIAALYLTASSFCLSSHLSTRCPLGMNVSSAKTLHQLLWKMAVFSDIFLV